MICKDPKNEKFLRSNYPNKFKIAELKFNGCSKDSDYIKKASEVNEGFL